MALRVLWPCLLALLFTACTSTPTANMDFDSSFDFGPVKTIAIQPINRTVASTIIVSDMQVSRINEAITQELEQRGYRMVADNAQADLLLTWHLITQERMDVRNYNTSIRYNCWNCGGSNVRVTQFTQGTFIVDLIDPERLQSVWRSVFESRLRNQPDPAQAEENRRAAAAAIFAGFPPN